MGPEKDRVERLDDGRLELARAAMRYRKPTGRTPAAMPKGVIANCDLTSRNNILSASGASRL